MDFKRRVYRSFANFYPANYKNYLAKELIYGGDKIHVDYWLGASFFLGFLLGFAVFLIPWTFTGMFNLWFLFLSVLMFLLAQFFIYMIIYYKMKSRTDRIERVLPDMLQLVASNLRAGMTPYHAMKMAAKEEFGPLKEELEYATTKALGIANFGDALLTIKDHVNSDMLDRALELLTSSLRAGGKLADVLSNVAADLAESRDLRRDLLTQTKTYSMFIMFMVAFGAPLLLGISFQFLNMVTDIYTSSSVEGGLVGEIAITSEFFAIFSIFFLLVTSILASVLMGTISQGDVRYGLKNAPLIFVVSVILLYIVRYAVGGLIG
jgi:pilus assembly protein TadC